MTLTHPIVVSLTALEMARAIATAGVTLGEVDALYRDLLHPLDADPSKLERAVTLAYAWAWQWARRDEPGVTWEEAQRWRVEFDATVLDPIAEAETVARVAAARVSGLPPEDAGQLTIAELGAYAELAKGQG